MTPSRPYLVRAIYEWLVDNQATPYLLLDATAQGVRVPLQYIKDGKIVLNIAPHAVKELLVHNEGVSFSARFNGAAMSITAPMSAVLAIYARENGQGMFFDANEEFAESEGMADQDEASATAPALTAVTTTAVVEDASTEGQSGAIKPKSAAKRPSLHVVK